MSELASALEAMAADDLEAMPTSQLGADVLALLGVAARLDAEIARRLVGFDRRGGAAADGAASTAAWLRHRARLAPGAARSRVLLARRLADDLPVTAAALAGGEVTYQHAEVIARATADLDVDTVRAGEAILLAAARETDPLALAHAGRHLRHAVAPERMLAEARAAHAERYLTVAQTFQGTVAIQGSLDPEAGALVLTALAPLASPTGPDDDRDAGQRRADALIELARRSLDAGTLPDIGGERPHLTVTVDLATLRDQAGSPAAELDWAQPMPAATARRIACDAGVTSMLLRGASEVLDVGRRTRTVPPALRRALAVRDRGCVFDGCTRPPPFCDAHHVDHWIDGGPTALANLVLLCRFHHRRLHEDGGRLHRNPNGTVTAVPAAQPP
jgi:hypothetical protein